MSDDRPIRVGDRVFNAGSTGVFAETSTIRAVVDKVKGPEVFVDWEFWGDGEKCNEYVPYYCHQFTWDEKEQAWDLGGNLGHI